jgi:hypothetical protein
MFQHKQECRLVNIIKVCIEILSVAVCTKSFLPQGNIQ